MKRKNKQFLQVLIHIIGLLVILYFINNIGVHVIWNKIINIDYYKLLIIFSFPFVGLFFHTFGWYFLLNNKSNYRFIDFLKTHIASNAITTLVPLGLVAGEPYRIYFFKKVSKVFKNDELVHSTITFNILHFALSFLIVAIAAIYIILFFSVKEIEKIEMVNLGLFVVFIGMLFLVVLLYNVQRKSYIFKILEKLNKVKFLRRIFKAFFFKILNINEKSRKISTRKINFNISFLFIFLAKFFGILEFYLIMKIVGLPIGFNIAFIVYAGNIFMHYLFFFIPDNSGKAEGSISFLFSLLGKTSIYSITLIIYRKAGILLWAFIGMMIAFIKPKKRCVLKKLMNKSSECSLKNLT